MSVDDRLRSGMVRNALSVDLDVEARLEATWARRRRDRRIRASALVGALAAACAVAVIASSAGWGRGEASGSLVPAGPPSAVAATRSTGGAAQGIPVGTWTREVTLAEISRRGLTLSSKEVADNHLTDGSVRLVLQTRSSSWSLLVEDDTGQLEVGDTGSTGYDAEGRWVQHGDNTGGVTVLSWRVDGPALVTSGLSASAPDGDHVFLEGTWLRES